MRYSLLSYRKASEGRGAHYSAYCDAENRAVTRCIDPADSHYGNGRSTRGDSPDDSCGTAGTAQYGVGNGRGEAVRKFTAR